MDAIFCENDLVMDVRRTPLSRYGSFFSIMPASGGPRQSGDRPTGGPRLGGGLYLRCHRARGVGQRLCFRIDATRDGEAIKTESELRPTGLTLRDDSGRWLRFCFAPEDTIRIAGQGLGLRFEAEPEQAVVAYRQDESRWVVNLRPALSRFLFDALVGSVTVDAPWGADECEHVVVTVEPDEHEHLEAAVDAFQSTWIPRDRPAFDAVQREVGESFDLWMADQLPLADDADANLRAARSHAGYVTWSAVIDPLGFIQRPAMLMSKVVMDQVWSWDNCFNAMALAGGRPDLAWDQLWVMLDHQDEHGALPDGLNPMFKHYNFSKPPVMGWALDHMMRANPDWFTDDRLEAIQPRLVRLTDWWLTHRRMEGHILPHYLHGNDSGWDNSTLFDQGVPLASPDLAAVLILQLETQAAIARRLNQPDEAERFQAEAARLLDALCEQLWQSDRFLARVLPEGMDVACESLIPCVPIVLGERLPEAIRGTLIERIEGFLTDYGLATERTDSPHYRDAGYWRGPIWAPPTMLICDGLTRLGETALRQRIAQRFCRTCARSGFAENFNALTGAPNNDTAYTWTASVFLLLVGDVRSFA